MFTDVFRDASTAMSAAASRASPAVSKPPAGVSGATNADASVPHMSVPPTLQRMNTDVLKDVL